MGLIAISTLPKSWFRRKCRVTVKTIKKLVTMRDKIIKRYYNKTYSYSANVLQIPTAIL